MVEGGTGCIQAVSGGRDSLLAVELSPGSSITVSEKAIIDAASEKPLSPVACADDSQLKALKGWLEGQPSMKFIIGGAQTKRTPCGIDYEIKRTAVSEDVEDVTVTFKADEWTQAGMKHLERLRKIDDAQRLKSSSWDEYQRYIPTVKAEFNFHHKYATGGFIPTKKFEDQLWQDADIARMKHCLPPLPQDRSVLRNRRARNGEMLIIALGNGNWSSEDSTMYLEALDLEIKCMANHAMYLSRGMFHCSWCQLVEYPQFTYLRHDSRLLAIAKAANLDAASLVGNVARAVSSTEKRHDELLLIASMLAQEGMSAECMNQFQFKRQCLNADETKRHVLRLLKSGKLMHNCLEPMCFAVCMAAIGAFQLTRPDCIVKKDGMYHIDDPLIRDYIAGLIT